MSNGGIANGATDTSSETIEPKSKPDNATAQVHQKASKRKQSTTTTTTLTQATLRKPRWTYFHLSLDSTPPTSDPLDALTARSHLTSALQQFLGLTGTAVPVDILKLEGRDVWIRVPREDGAGVFAAVGAWVGGGGDGTSVGWRVKGRDEWLVRLSGGDGMDLFEGGR